MPSISTETYDSILALRAVRSFTAEVVPDHVMGSILEAGRWTGSSKNTQPWAFVLIDDAATRERLADCGRFSTPLRIAPQVVVLVRLPGGGDFDMGRAAQNLMLAAAAQGVATCPVTLHDEDCARHLIGVPPDHGCRHAIALGYRDDEEHRRSRAAMRGMVGAGRRPLEELVHRSTFGG